MLNQNPNQQETPTFDDKSCDRYFLSQEIMEVEFKAKYNFGSITFSLSPTPAVHILKNNIFHYEMWDFYMSTDPAI